MTPSWLVVGPRNKWSAICVAVPLLLCNVVVTDRQFSYSTSCMDKVMELPVYGWFAAFYELNIELFHSVVKF